MKQIHYILSLMLALIIQTGQAQEWSIAFSPVNVDCITKTSCYNVIMKTKSDAFEMGSSNLRLFYNAGTQRFLKKAGAINVNRGYQISNGKINNQTASLKGKGSLAFDANIGLLDIPIDFSGNAADALTIGSKAYAVLASNICFESGSKESVANPSDFVWVTAKTKEAYTTAETTINGVGGESTDLKSSNFVTQQVETRSDCSTSSLLVSANNYPNPFSESTKLTYLLQYDTQVKLSVYAMDGRLVLDRKVDKSAGSHQFVITKDQLDGAGVYVYKIQTSNNSLESRMILMK